MSPNQHTHVYTETPLLNKLGISEDMKVFTINAPENYIEMLGDLPEGVEIMPKTERKVEFVHIFTTSKDTLPLFLQVAINHIYSMGAIWVSWPRNEEGGELSEQVIKQIAATLKLRDEKYTIINDDWNGIMLRMCR